jgi:hypothetical protein
MCQVTARAKEIYLEDEETGDGMLLTLRNWCFRLHTHIFNWACFNAFELKHHSKWCGTHIFVVKLRTTGRAADSGGRNHKKMFKVMDASLVPRSAFPEFAERFARFDQETHREGETRPKTWMGILCGDMWVDKSSYWDEEEIAERSESKDWKAIFKSVTDGKKEYEMIQGNPVRR